jgi:hypothetical protein
MIVPRSAVVVCVSIGMAASLPAADAFAGKGAAPDAAVVAARAELMTTTDEPVRQVRTADGRLFLDFGKASFGWLALEFPAAHPDLALTVRLGEKLAGAETIDAKAAKAGASIAYREVPLQVPAVQVTGAAPPVLGESLYNAFVRSAQAAHPVVQTGQFGADMQVHLVNDGPVTIPLTVR